MTQNTALSQESCGRRHVHLACCAWPIKREVLLIDRRHVDTGLARTYSTEVLKMRSFPRR
jgi:hypothetical protein